MPELRRPSGLDHAWNQVLLTKYQGALPSEGASLFDLPKLLSPAYLEPTLTYQEDTLPKGRKKLIHPVGTVAVLRFVPRQSHDAPVATGLLAEEQLLLARFSVADPGKNQPFAPGIALKFYARDGATFPGPTTRNVVGVISLEGSWGPKLFFRNALTTHVPNPNAFPYEMVNQQAQEAVEAVCPGAGRDSLIYPLDNLCNIDRAGRKVASPRVPSRVEFWPTGDARKIYFDDDARGEDFRVRLSKFAKGTHVYRLWAAAEGSPSANLPVGDLLIEEPPIACRYGDEELFFQHQYADIELS